MTTMLETEIIRPLPTEVSENKIEATVEEIIRLHADIQNAARTSLAKAIRIGELLFGVKTGLKHGEWLPWLQGNVPFSSRTATNYLRIHANRDRIKSETVSDLAGAYALLTEPKEGRQTLNRPHHFDDIPKPEDWLQQTEEFQNAVLAWCHEDCDRAKEAWSRAQADSEGIRTCMTAMNRMNRWTEFWHVVTLKSERKLGEAINEIERISRESRRSASSHLHGKRLPSESKPNGRAPSN